MKIYYAIYDPSSSIDGNYWTWSASEVKPLLNRFYGDAASRHLPPKPNELQGNDLWGGMVRLSNWTVVYRYFDGGRDKQGRPGRYVMLTAWIPADDAHHANLLPLFDNATFKHVAGNAKTIPVPPPFALEEHCPSSDISPASFRDGETSFTDLTQAMQAFAGISSRRKTRFAIADVKIIKTAKEQKFVLNVVPEIKPQSETQPRFQTPMPAAASASNISADTRSHNRSIQVAAGIFVSLLAVMTLARLATSAGCSRKDGDVVVTPQEPSPAIHAEESPDAAHPRSDTNAPASNVGTDALPQENDAVKNSKIEIKSRSILK